MGDSGSAAGSAPPAEERLVAEAVELAQGAGQLSLSWFRSPELSVDRKGDGSPVTQADRAVERFLREEICHRYPDDGIVGEEEEPQPSTSGRTWVLDPIDGTKAFTRGVPLYANLLALEDDYGAAVGVVNIPAIGQMIWAGRGRGCWLNGVSVGVSDAGDLDGAYITSSGYESWDEDALLAVKRAGTVLRTWGDGYGYLLVASGQVDAMVDPFAARYDLAPMPVILAEAGGAFTDLQGRPTTTGGSGVATNGRLHGSLLACLAGDPR